MSRCFLDSGSLAMKHKKRNPQFEFLILGAAKGIGDVKDVSQNNCQGWCAGGS